MEIPPPLSTSALLNSSVQQPVTPFPTCFASPSFNFLILNPHTDLLQQVWSSITTSSTRESTTAEKDKKAQGYHWWLLALLWPLSSTVKCPLLSKSEQYSASSIVDIHCISIHHSSFISIHHSVFVSILVLLSVLNHQNCRRIGRGPLGGQYLIIMGGILHTCRWAQLVNHTMKQLQPTLDFYYQSKRW